MKLQAAASGASLALTRMVEEARSMYSDPATSSAKGLFRPSRQLINVGNSHLWNLSHFALKYVIYISMGLGESM